MAHTDKGEVQLVLFRIGISLGVKHLKTFLESLDELSEAEIEALWAEEAERRLDELEQGLVTEISAEDPLRRARAAIS